MCQLDRLGFSEHECRQTRIHKMIPLFQPNLSYHYILIVDSTILYSILELSRWMQTQNRSKNIQKANPLIQLPLIGSDLLLKVPKCRHYTRIEPIDSWNDRVSAMPRWSLDHTLNGNDSFGGDSFWYGWHLCLRNVRWCCDLTIIVFHTSALAKHDDHFVNFFTPISASSSNPATKVSLCLPRLSNLITAGFLLY